MTTGASERSPTALSRSLRRVQFAVPCVRCCLPGRRAPCVLAHLVAPKPTGRGLGAGVVRLTTVSFHQRRVARPRAVSRSKRSIVHAQRAHVRKRANLHAPSPLSSPRIHRPGRPARAKLLLIALHSSGRGPSRVAVRLMQRTEQQCRDRARRPTCDVPPLPMTLSTRTCAFCAAARAALVAVHYTMYGVSELVFAPTGRPALSPETPGSRSATSASAHVSRVASGTVLCRDPDVLDTPQGPGRRDVWIPPKLCRYTRLSPCLCLARVRCRPSLTYMLGILMGIVERCMLEVSWLMCTGW
ncbi:hypothetical protein BD413DRAFT_311352 [Trametes elegans]|nr:hypothetical protein BD413DRAFT_311352 [Trametes elegans]